MSGPIATIHVLFSVLAIAVGVVIFSIRRGTPVHRRLGYVYIGAMLALNGSALMLYARDGSFGPFHIAALLSLATLTAGAVPVMLRRPRGGWLPLHWELMSWSFVGLIAAAVAEAVFRIPGIAYWPSIITGTLAVFVGGGAWVYRNRRHMRQAAGHVTGA
ncbi:DUF2306 domain-containing protein [Sinimarinibacterium flocculans]|uniref:Putative membrane protein n=1 Tax=Sinimarinibacterium flocculans TaxID=985250 RepID=A0A318E0R3_9GAMM|nr:DUF2306 domain-containing protein [Sinimarinibacterium flocculans]PXV64260.1 putative membrane protein [Sinimarinibacterium flocculans]